MFKNNPLRKKKKVEVGLLDSFYASSPSYSSSSSSSCGDDDDDDDSSTSAIILDWPVVEEDDNIAPLRTIVSNTSTKTNINTHLNNNINTHLNNNNANDVQTEYDSDTISGVVSGIVSHSSNSSSCSSSSSTLDDNDDSSSSAASFSTTSSASSSSSAGRDEEYNDDDDFDTEAMARTFMIISPAPSNSSSNNNKTDTVVHRNTTATNRQHLLEERRRQGHYRQLLRDVAAASFLTTNTITKESSSFKHPVNKKSNNNYISLNGHYNNNNNNNKVFNRGNNHINNMSRSSSSKKNIWYPPDLPATTFLGSSSVSKDNDYEYQATKSFAEHQWHKAHALLQANPALMTCRTLCLALQHCPPLNMIESMLRINPDAAGIPATGPTPLQVALQSSCSVPVVHVLIQACPLALVPRHGGNSHSYLDPLSYAKRFRSNEKELIQLLSLPLSHWLGLGNTNNSNNNIKNGGGSSNNHGRINAAASSGGGGTNNTGLQREKNKSKTRMVANSHPNVNRPPALSNISKSHVASTTTTVPLQGATAALIKSYPLVRDHGSIGSMPPPPPPPPQPQPPSMTSTGPRRQRERYVQQPDSMGEMKETTATISSTTKASTTTSKKTPMEVFPVVTNPPMNTTASLAVASSRLASHATSSVLTAADRQEINNVKFLCLALLKAHKRMAKNMEDAATTTTTTVGSQEVVQSTGTRSPVPSYSAGGGDDDDDDDLSRILTPRADNTSTGSTASANSTSDDDNTSTAPYDEKGDEKVTKDSTGSSGGVTSTLFSMLQENMEQRQFKQFRTCLIAMDMKERAMKGAMRRLEERLWKAVTIQNPLQSITTTANNSSSSLALPQQEQQQQVVTSSAFNTWGMDSALVPAAAVAAAEAAVANVNTLLNNLRSSYVHMHNRFLEMEERVNHLSTVQQQQANMSKATKQGPVNQELSTSFFSESSAGKENNRDTSFYAGNNHNSNIKKSRKQEPMDSFDVDWPSGKKKPKSNGSKKKKKPTPPDASSMSSSIMTSSTAGTVNLSSRRRENVTQNTSTSTSSINYSFDKHYFASSNDSGSNSSSFYEEEQEEIVSLLCHDAEAGENGHAYGPSDIFVLRGARNRLGCVLSTNSLLSNSHSNQDHHGGQAVFGGNGAKHYSYDRNSSNHPCARPWFKNRGEKTPKKKHTSQ